MAVKNKKVFTKHQSVRDPLVIDAGATAPVQYVLQADSGGNATYSAALAPLGIAAPVITNGTTANSIVISEVPWNPAQLPWLRSTAGNYERYRVTRATLIFNSSVASTATGRIMMDSDTDAADFFTQQNLGSSSGGKITSLAATANKELRFQLDVDTSWKKVSNVTGRHGGANPAQLLIVNSINDLMFTGFYVTVVGAAANTVLGGFSVEYDVEFREPISFIVNT